MTDPRSIAALDVAERHAKSEATDDELSAARDASWAASWAASSAAVRAAWDAWDTAKDASWAEAWAAWDAASAASWAAAWDAELAEQQKILDEIRAAINELEGET